MYATNNWFLGMMKNLAEIMTYRYCLLKIQKSFLISLHCNRLETKGYRTSRWSASGNRTNWEFERWHLAKWKLRFNVAFDVTYNFKASLPGDNLYQKWQQIVKQHKGVDSTADSAGQWLISQHRTVEMVEIQNGKNWNEQNFADIRKRSQNSSFTTGNHQSLCCPQRNAQLLQLIRSENLVSCPWFFQRE